MHESITLSLTGNATILSVNYFPPINLYEDSEIALLCLQSFNSFPNINENNNKFPIQVVDNENNITPMICFITLEEGCYEIEDIKQRVKKQIDVYNSKNFTDLTFDITVDPNDFRSSIKCNGILHFEIPYSIAPVFGFEKRVYKPYIKTLRSEKAVNLNTINCIKVMCNIAQGSISNHLQSHSIYEFFASERTGSKVIQSPPNLIYYKLNKTDIDSITVQLVNQDHNPIDNFGMFSEADKKKLSNNGYSYLFEKIRLEINGIEVDSTRFLGITSSLKGYLSGTPDNYNCYENSGRNFKNATQSANDKGEFSACIPLKYWLGFFEDYRKILVNSRLELILTRSHSDLNALSLKSGITASTAKVTLNKIIWKVLHITVDDGERLKLLKLVEKEKKSYYEKSIRNPILSPSTFLSNAPIIVIDTSKQNDSATALAVDVQLEIEASESLTGVTAYCLLIHDRILEYVPFTREVRKLV
ncbi:hypothetical protein QTP88_013918 [Uroleucon formosanum]